MESDLGRGRWRNAVGGWVKEREREKVRVGGCGVVKGAGAQCILTPSF